MDASSVLEILRQALPDVQFADVSSVDMPGLQVDRESLVATLTTLRDHPSLQFAFFSDLTAVDFLPAEPRFELVYHLACLGPAYAQSGGAAPPRRLRVKVRVLGADARMPTSTTVYPAAGWPEREVFDLFGVVFEGHADLRRILMTDDWEGHPLRKDYPVQIRKTAASWSPMQMTAEEFAHRVSSAREGAVTQSKAGPFDKQRAANKPAEELMEAIDLVRGVLKESGELHRRMAQERADVIVRAAEVMGQALVQGRQVLVFGNGGSATDAQHFAAELVGRFERERRAVPVIALTTDTAILTAIGNDYGYDLVFARQVEALGRMGDVAMGITTSGASASVNRALERAKAKGLITIGLTGRDGGETGRLAHVHVNVPGRTTARTQEVHRTILHAICELIEPEL